MFIYVMWFLIVIIMMWWADDMYEPAYVMGFKVSILFSLVIMNFIFLVLILGILLLCKCAELDSFLKRKILAHNTTPWRGWGVTFEAPEWHRFRRARNSCWRCHVVCKVSYISLFHFASHCSWLQYLHFCLSLTHVFPKHKYR